MKLLLLILSWKWLTQWVCTTLKSFRKLMLHFLYTSDFGETPLPRQSWRILLSYCHILLTNQLNLNSITNSAKFKSPGNWILINSIQLTLRHLYHLSWQASENNLNSYDSSWEQNVLRQWNTGVMYVGWPCSRCLMLLGWEIT